MKKYLVSLLIVGAVLLAGGKAADAHVRFSFGFAVAPPAFGYYSPYAYSYPATYPYYYPRYSYPHGYYPGPYYRRYYSPRYYYPRYERYWRDRDDGYYRR